MHKKKFIFICLTTCTILFPAQPAQPLAQEEAKKQLILAVQKSDFNNVVKLTEQYKVAEFFDQEGYTPLMHLYLSNPVKHYSRLHMSKMDQHMFESAQRHTTQNAQAITSRLLNQHADPNAVDKQTGNTVLMLAALAGHKKCVSLLLYKKADSRAKNKEGLDVFTMVENKKNDAKYIQEDALYNEIEDRLLPFKAK